jgi:phosphatidylinositol-3-phosphatase
MRLLLLSAAAVLCVAGCSNSATVHRSSGPPSTSGPVSPSSSASGLATSSSGPVTSPAGSRTATASGLPQPAHVIVVVLENHSFDEVANGAHAPFIQSLVHSGAVLTQYYAITHPSEPNYLAVFSGSTQGVTGDACPVTFRTGNLARSLLNAGQTFAGYSEGLPSTGYTGCTSGLYARRHVPWTDFTDLPSSVNRPLTAFPRSFAALPTVSFMIPNLVHDMHNGPLPQADTWLRQHLGAYVTWARTHNSLLVLTADEDDRSSANRIATIVVGDHVTPGRYAQRLTHYSLLRTIEDMYGLPRLGHSATAAGIAGIWR